MKMEISETLALNSILTWLIARENFRAFIRHESFESIHPSTHKPTHPFIHPSTQKSVHQSIYPSIHPSIYPWLHSPLLDFGRFSVP
jgi:hypothetical protein